MVKRLLDFLNASPEGISCVLLGEFFLLNLILIIECYYGIIGTVTYAYKQKVRN